MKRSLKFTQVFLWIVFGLLLSTSVFAKTLKIEGSLPISKENESLITVVALENGWSPEALYDSSLGVAHTVSPTVYVSEIMVQPYLKNYITDKVQSSCRSRYGQAANDRCDAIAAAVGKNLNLSVSFSND